MRDQVLKPNSSYSKKPDLIAATIGPQRTAYILQRRLIFALLGTLIAVFSVVLFLGTEAHAQATLEPSQPAPTLGTVANGGGVAQAPVGGRGGGGAIPAAQEQATPLEQQIAPERDLRSSSVPNPVYERTALVQEQITPVQQEPAPLGQQVRPVYDQAAPIQNQSAPVRQQVTEPVQQTAGFVVGTIEQTTDPVVVQVQQKVKPLAEPTRQTVEPVLNTAKGTADPVIKPVTDRVDATTKPVLDTVNKTAKPVVEPIRETVEPVVDKVGETVKPVVDPVKKAVDPVAKPVISPAEGTVAPDPVAVAALGQQTEPVAGPALDLALRAESSPVVAPVPEEGGAALAASASVNSSALAMAKGLSLGASSGSALASSVLGVSNFEASSSNGWVGSQQALLTATTSGHPAVAPLFSVGEHSSILDFAASSTYGTSNQLPQSLPFSGALPAAGSAPGGSAPSAGSAGSDLGGVLTVLLIALLGGKFLWNTREFLKPKSAFQLVIIQPG